jgi:hypothetical protein
MLSVSYELGLLSGLPSICITGLGLRNVPEGYRICYNRRILADI